MYYFCQEDVGIARQSRFGVICLYYIYIKHMLQKPRKSTIWYGAYNVKNNSMEI